MLKQRVVIAGAFLYVLISWGFGAWAVFFPQNIFAFLTGIFCILVGCLIATRCVQMWRELKKDG